MSFVRVAGTGSVVNNDDSHFKAVLAARYSKKLSKNLEDELLNLRDEVAYIREQFVKLLETTK